MIVPTSIQAMHQPAFFAKNESGSAHIISVIFLVWYYQYITNHYLWDVHMLIRLLSPNGMPLHTSEP